MKNLILCAIAMATLLASCNQKNKEAVTTASETPQNASQLYACPMHPKIIGKHGEKCSKCGMDLTVPVTQTKTPNDATFATATKPSYVDDVINSYINLKNKLVKDDTDGAAIAGKAIVAELAKVDMERWSADQMKSYVEVADDAKEHAEHIGSNGGNIEHQREHFVLLSKDISDLITTFGTERKLYQDFCPMANDNKGAIWISETKEIKNPYLGAKMPTCGSVKKEL